MASKRFQSIIIGAGFPLTQLAILLYTPILPFLSSVFQVSSKTILMTPTVITVGYLIGHLFWGTLSDYYGRRRALIIGLVLFFLSSFLVSISSSLVLFWVFACILGFSAATFTSVGNAMMKDIYGHEKAVQAIARIGIAMAVTPLVVPFLGIFLYQTFTWRAIYFFMGLYALLMFICVIAFVRHRHEKEVSSHGLLKAYGLHLSNFSFLQSVTVLGLTFGILVTSLSMLSFVYIQQIGVSKSAFAWLGFLVVLPYPLFAIFSNQWVGRLGTKRLIGLGAVLTLLGALGLYLLFFFTMMNVALITIAFMFTLGGAGFSLSMCKAHAMHSVHQNLGVAASLMKFIQTMGAVIVTAVNASLHEAHGLDHYGLLMLIVAVLALCLVVVEMCLKRPAKIS